MSNILKRTLSFALALIMVLSLIPVAGISVYATEAEELVEAPTEETPAEEPAEEPKAEEPAEEIPQEAPVETDELEPPELTVKDTPAMAVEPSMLTSLSVKDLSAQWQYEDQQNGVAEWTVSDSNTLVCNIVGKLSGNLSISKLTLTNNMKSNATLKFDYKLISTSGSNGRPATVTGAISISSWGSGSYSEILTAGNSIDIIVTTPRAGSSNTLTLSNIALVSTVADDPTVTFKVAEGGSYVVGTEEITAETTKTAAAGTDYQLIATPAEGYQFFGWYNETSETYWSYTAEQKFTAIEDAVIKPLFLPAATAIFSVGSARFYDLTDAGEAAAAGTEKTIILLNDGTVEGSHTIPAGTTLLIPHNDANSIYRDGKSDAYNYALANCVNAGLETHVDWVKPSKYRELTLAEGATITVNGEIEVSGQHAAAGGGDSKHGGSPTGKLGYIKMEENSNITLNSGATLYCWGYIYGEGTVTAKSGSTVYENFQIMDFRGGNETLGLGTMEPAMVFPLSQYYVQNIEVAATFEAGATEYIATSLFAANKCVGAAVKFIGSSAAMFQPAEGAKIVKEYDPVNDELSLTTYGNCSLASLTIDLEGLPIDTESGAIDSANFVLPITNNINIIIKSGTATLTQDVMLLPGSSLTVDQGATLNIAEYHKLQVFDSENWTKAYKIVDMDTWAPSLEPEENLKFCYPATQFVPIDYSPTKEKTRTTADLTDVTVDINGTVLANGAMYSTTFWEFIINPDDEEDVTMTISGGGANIISSQQSGTFVMQGGAGEDMGTFLYDQSKGKQSEDSAFTGAFYMIPLASAMLKNGDGTMLDTTGAEAGATYKYCKKHDHWSLGECTKTTCEITWVGADNESLGTQEFATGATPVYSGETPVKDGYTFAGWSTKANGEGDKYPISTALPAVTADTTYFAYFTENTSGLKGDVNLDKAVNMEDAVMLMKHVIKASIITNETSLANGEVTNDSTLAMEDAVKLMKYVIKAIDSLD